MNPPRTAPLQTSSDGASDPCPSSRPFCHPVFTVSSRAERGIRFLAILGKKADLSGDPPSGSPRTFAVNGVTGCGFCRSVVWQPSLAANNSLRYACSTVPGWRNGIRGGLKIPCPPGRAGSTPAPGTIKSPMFMRLFEGSLFIVPCACPTFSDLGLNQSLSFGDEPGVMLLCNRQFLVSE